MRRAKRIDSNQNEIVDQLRSIPGVTVEVDHDDILVGRNGLTYWFEIKTPECVGKNGNVWQSELKQSQKDLLKDWAGHYEVVWSIEQILETIGLKGVTP